MTYLFLYLGIMLVGYFAGTKVRTHAERFSFTAKIQTVTIVILVLSMGMRMGMNEEVITQLNTIGLYALIITLVVMLFSLIGLYIVRRAMGFDRRGYLKRQDVNEENENQKEDMPEEKKNHFTLMIVLAVIAGLLVGRFFIFAYVENIATTEAIVGWCITIGLCILMFFVGLDLGIEGTVVQSIRTAGWRVLVIPLTIFISTFLGALVCDIFLPLSTKESLAIAGGFGWYTLAPGMIMDSGHVVAAAVAFIHNVLRELFSIMLIPVVANRIGYIETISLAGATSLDVCLPVVEKSTRGDIAVFAFVSGLVLTIVVPLVVPFILGF